LQIDPASSYVAFDQVQSESILGQLSDTTAELRELKFRQQQLEARNVLLEKVAELNIVQQSGDWGVGCSSECTLLFCILVQQWSLAASMEICTSNYSVNYCLFKAHIAALTVLHSLTSGCKECGHDTHLTAVSWDPILMSCTGATSSAGLCLCPYTANRARACSHPHHLGPGRMHICPECQQHVHS